MTIASPSFRWRRVLALFTASVLLHYLALGWGATYLALPPRNDTEIAPAVIVASLRAPPPVPAAPVPPPAPRPRPKPRAAAAPVAAPDPVEAPAETGAADPAPPVQSDSVVQSVPEPVAEPAPEEVPAAPPAAPSLRVSLPPSVELAMNVERTDAKGVNWSGQSLLSWRNDGAAYRMSLVASVQVVVTINLVELASEGAIGDAGIAPRTMTEKRRNRSATATHFDAQQGRISFSASAASVPLAPGAQDKATFPMQLAGIARADPAQLEAGVEMLVGEEKNASPFRFTVVGQEEIETPMGRIATWRLTRPPLPGSYGSRLDVWLAPAHHWYPVQLRSTEGNGAVTTQTINRITIKGAGS